MLAYAFLWGILIQQNVGNDVMKEKTLFAWSDFCRLFARMSFSSQILVEFVENLYVAIV